MNIPKEMIAVRFHHKYAGEDWAVVDAHEGEWCDCVWTGKYEVGNRVFRVWKRLLTVQKQTVKTMTDYGKEKWVKTDKDDLIPDKLMDNIKDIRNRLASGKWAIVRTRLVKV